MGRFSIYDVECTVVLTIVTKIRLLELSFCFHGYTRVFIAQIHFCIQKQKTAVTATPSSLSTKRRTLFQMSLEAVTPQALVLYERIDNGRACF
jgi:hypothetical protein